MRVQTSLKTPQIHRNKNESNWGPMHLHYLIKQRKCLSR